MTVWEQRQPRPSICSATTSFDMTCLIWSHCGLDWRIFFDRYAVGPYESEREAIEILQGCDGEPDLCRGLVGGIALGNQPRQEHVSVVELNKRIRAMLKDLSREEEKRGTGRVLMWGAVIAALLFVALMAVFVFGPFWS
ncbi:hypothetical protein [Mesorhizobium escarrei]|nr:hypothetical protein [Mesorhizobium escarrei]